MGVAYPVCRLHRCITFMITLKIYDLIDSPQGYRYMYSFIIFHHHLQMFMTHQSFENECKCENDFDEIWEKNVKTTNKNHKKTYRKSIQLKNKQNR